MELLPAFGLATKELFDYNRENFQFDAEQRIKRELLRLDMQVTRFNLFREDIRDMVELTVGKMEMYHLVGALFLEKTVALYCEGRIREQMPPFLLALYFLSVAGGYAYLVLAVWLSMYASICSHSFGVRLLTRFVRLPIPGAEQLDTLNARLAEFESQRKHMLRVPFVGDNQEWKRRAPLSSVEEEGSSARDVRAAGSGGSEGGGPVVANVPGLQEDFLGGGELPLGAQENFMRAAAVLPGKHVQLYRRLQNKWQCYDAYTRVSMGLGTYNILLAFTFYLIDVTLIQFESPSTTYSCIVIFMFTGLALCYIDISKLGHCMLWLMQALPTAVAFLASIEANVADKLSEGHVLNPNNKYYAAPICFFLMVIWFEMLLRVAWPSRDDAQLPRRFRAVLFLDVFEDTDVDMQKAEGMATKSLFATGGFSRRQKPLLTVKLARDSDEALFKAHAAVRRWEAVPAGLTDVQRTEVANARREINIWREALNAEAADRAQKRGMQDSQMLLELDDRPWNEISEQEQSDDPHAGTLVGPFEHNDSRGTSTYYFSLESAQFIYRAAEGASILTLEDVHAMVEEAESQVRLLLGGETLASGMSSASLDSLAASSVDSGTDSAGPLRSASSRSLRSGFALAGAAIRRTKSQLSVNATYVPPRLPWRILYLITRALQVAWLLEGLIYAFEAADLFKFDYQNFIQVEERRLSAQQEPWRFEPLSPAFPQGDFFLPSSVSCLPSSAFGEHFLLSTPREQYLVQAAPDTTAVFKALPDEQFPPGAVAFCATEAAGPAGIDWSTATRTRLNHAPCILGSLARGGTAVALWPFGAAHAEAQFLPLAGGDPWERLSGAVARCAQVSQLLPAAANSDRLHQEWCLVLAGHDGTRLPVAVLELRGGPGTLPEPTAKVNPVFDVPVLSPFPNTDRVNYTHREIGWRPKARAPQFPRRLTPEEWEKEAAEKEGQEPRTVSAIHVDARADGSPRLLVLLSIGWMEAWDLVQPMNLGHWRPVWPNAGAKQLETLAMCGSSAGHVHVVGHNVSQGPRWLRALDRGIVSASLQDSGADS